MTPSTLYGITTQYNVAASEKKFKVLSLCCLFHGQRNDTSMSLRGYNTIPGGQFQLKVERIIMDTRIFTFKYVVVGDGNVGKSCLVDQFTRRTFQESHLTTIGVNLAEVTRSIRINEAEVRIQLWDTAGMEVYRSLTTAYYRNTAVTLLVYDVTRRRTFENLTRWLKDIREACNNAHMIIFVVGNKIDLEKEREVSRQDGQKFAVDNKLFFTETSAKIHETVEKVFFLTARVYYEKIDMGDIDINNRPSLYGVKLDDRNMLEDFDDGGSRRGSQRCDC